ncbi:type II toxin-antitoxin system HigA family antitoxin [Persicitalea sp.]|uniref:helix-turn-helix domain-containing protein n=1 Tax=Persicitalea sp. TaxID=3100273 RepID=UPI003593E079
MEASKMKPIKTEAEYDDALVEVQKVFDAKRNTPEGDLLEVLSLLIYDYEQKHYKIESLSPLEALRCEMEEQGLTQSSLAERIGMSKSTISEILNGRKQMSVRFLKFLHKDLGIPADILLS